MEILRSQFMTNENIVIFVLLAGVLFYIKILSLPKLLRKHKDIEYKSLYFNHSCAIFTLDLNGNIIDTNPAAEELTGYEKKELVKRPFSNLLTSKSLTIQSIQFNYSLKRKSNEYSVTSIRKNGIEQTLFIKTIPIMKRRKTNGLFLIVHDFTENLSIKISMQKTNEQLQSYNNRTSDAINDTNPNKRNHGRNTYCFYNKEIEEKSSRTILLESELRNAINNNYFYLVYQPQINLFTGETECIEILLRFDHPLLGSVSPQEFIPICEKAGIINDITAWIIEQTGIQYTKWIAKGFTPVKFAINFSPLTLKDERFVEKLVRSVNVLPFPPKYLEIEVTENALLEDFAAIRNNLFKLKDIAVTIALDDFGTGYSSFLYLKNLPIDKIKIAKEFVQGMTGEYGGKDQAIINSIISLAKEIDIDVVCEGVETSEQADYLLKAQCKYAQGYHFYKPLTAEELEEKRVLCAHSFIQ